VRRSLAAVQASDTKPETLICIRPFTSSPACRGRDLTGNPRQAIAAVYDFVGERPFAHDFENIEYDAAEFDRRLGTPGLHSVGRRVERHERRTILPPALVRKYENDAFWRDPARIPNKVRVV
jgi:sulfotransferase